MKSTISFSAAACVATLAGLASAHNSIIYPCPRYSPVGLQCPAVPAGQTANGDINSPISSVQLGYSQPLCRFTTPYATPSATWTAGQSVTIKFNPNAVSHSGGNCEFSMSYDGGKTFAVIHRELRYCFVGSKPASLTNAVSVSSYTFNLPADLPSSDKAVFAWSWVNASGNREFYMNCADVAIKGGSSKSYTGPQMVIANYQGYPTIPEFNGNYETGMEHYTGAKNITVSPSGSTTGGGSGGSGNSAPPASSSAAPAKSSTPPASTARDSSATPGVPHKPQESGGSSAPASSASGNSGACTSGLMQCSGTGYQICNEGVWSPVYSCGVGASCKGSDGHIYCGWP
ncbi:hypothetical protein GGH94_002754 [Coemansia aciculifera]|uniref:Chitin-binding type-4 domain-containing protein n=1 Tax=Coemansia aciculifera TaxID=417176 RepID=A0A9W8IRR4_9FUNG|nr:hypothetical protein GGH94_002754 [Coemansia aciculifera]KAJ2873887.1 hypothetical protein GGH93_002849 [Coemansia aciculifera]